MTKTNFKRKKISVTAVILIVLATVLVIGGVGYLSKGYQDMNVKGWIYERNPDNLLNYEMNVDRVENGIRTKIDAFGAVNISGYVADNGKDVEFTYELCSVTLPAGTYVLSTQEGNCSNNTVMFYGMYEDSTGKNRMWKSDNSKESVMTFTEETAVSFKIGVYKDDCDVNFTIHPILNEGTEPLEDFFVRRVSTK